MTKFTYHAAYIPNKVLALVHCAVSWDKIGHWTKIMAHIKNLTRLGRCNICCTIFWFVNTYVHGLIENRSIIYSSN